MEMMGIVSTELDNKSNPQTFLTEFPRREHIDVSGSFQTTLLHTWKAISNEGGDVELKMKAQHSHYM